MNKFKPDFVPAWERPIRIPDRIEITHADPPYALAGDISTWKIPFRISRDIASQAILMVQLWGGRNNHHGFAEAGAGGAEPDRFLAAELDDGAPVPVMAGPRNGTYRLSVPQSGLKRGRTLTVRLGLPPPGGSGARAGTCHAYDKFFVLYELPPEHAASVSAWPGLNVWNEETARAMVAACSLHILGNALHTFRIYAPATVKPGEPFAVLLRPEDAYGNMASERPGPVEVLSNGNALPATVEPVAESTCLRLVVRLAEEGVYRLLVRETRTGRAATSNPIVCSRAANRIFWGMIHGHTEMSDGVGKIDRYFFQLKNEVALDFAAPGDHDHRWETPDSLWAETCRAVKSWNAPGEFVTLPGYEWAKWRRNGDGDRNVYYLEDDRPIYRSDTEDHPTPTALFKALRENGEKAVVIPHHTGHGGNHCDWKEHDAEYERLVEIFQVRGSYECAPADGNPVPEKPGAIPQFEKGYVRDALALGWRVGFTAGGDDHGGQWGTEYQGGVYYKQGLMSVEAEAKTRPAIFAALQARRVTATTGARILLSFTVDGNPMGSEISLKRRPLLAASRRMRIAFHGTAPADRIEVIRNNRIVQVWTELRDLDCEFEWTDTEACDAAWMPPAKFCDHPFIFYYVRAIQQDGEVAWASPVWIDP